MNSITLKINIKWFNQDKIKNKQNSVVQKKVVYNYITCKYLQKINDKISKFVILCKVDIDHHKEFKNGYTNENNGPNVIDTSSEEGAKYSKMTQV